MRKPPEIVEPDERWQILVGDRESLVAVTARWETNESTTAQVADMLEICRRLFEHSYFVYEFGLVAVIWSVLAVEAALRDRLAGEAAGRDGLRKLVRKAHDRGLLELDQLEVLDAGAQLRNRLVHGETHGVLTPAQVAAALENAHAVIAHLYRRT
jgi:hypothetical protein